MKLRYVMKYEIKGTKNPRLGNSMRGKFGHHEGNCLKYQPDDVIDFTDSESTFNSVSISLVTLDKLSCNSERHIFSCSASSFVLKTSEHMKHFDCKVTVGSIIKDVCGRLEDEQNNVSEK